MRRIPVVMAVALSAGALAACGSDSNDDAGTAPKTTAATDAASMQRAEQAIAPYVGQPGPFPVTEPLKERPVGAKVAFMDPGSPTAAMMWGISSAAAEPLGIELYRVKAGHSAETINAAYASVVEQRPAAVIDAGIDPVLFKSALAKLHEAEIPILSSGVIDQDEHGFRGGVFSRAAVSQNGRLLADYVYSRHGAETDVVFGYIPEFAFGPIMKDAFMEEMKTLCESCEARELSLPAASIGTTMPSKIVSDLQSHPDTKTVVTATSEMLGGLPAALKAASLEVETTGSGGGPANLQMLKDGQQSSNLAVDFNVSMWTLMDMVARSITGEPIPAEQARGIPPTQFLTGADITGDPADGWTGYPDFAQRFAELWGADK